MENIQSPSRPRPRMTVPVSKPLKNELKITAVRRGQSLQELVQQILQTWIDEQAAEGNG